MEFASSYGLCTIHIPQTVSTEVRLSLYMLVYMIK